MRAFYLTDREIWRTQQQRSLHPEHLEMMDRQLETLAQQPAKPAEAEEPRLRVIPLR